MRLNRSWGRDAGSGEGWRMERVEHVHREKEEGEDAWQRGND